MLFLSSLTGSSAETQEIYLSVTIDENVTEYEKGIDKEYVFRDSRDFSDEFHALVHCEIVDYGVDDGSGELLRNLSERKRPMTLDLDWQAPWTSLTMRGWFFGDAGGIEFLGNGLKARLRLVGPKKATPLGLHQDLLLEGFGLEEGNKRLALFCYFSAAECIISNEIDEYKKTIPSELHYSLERLGIKDKLKIAARDALRTENLAQVEIWGEASSALDDTVRIRNQIAHPREGCDVSAEDVDRAFLAFQLIYSMLVDGHSKAGDIIRAHAQ